MLRKLQMLPSTQLIVVACGVYLVLYTVTLVSPLDLHAPQSFPSNTLRSNTLDEVPHHKTRTGYSSPKPNTFFKDPGKKSTSSSLETPPVFLTNNNQDGHKVAPLFFEPKNKNPSEAILFHSRTGLLNVLAIPDHRKGDFLNSSDERSDKGNRKVGHHQNPGYLRLKRTLLPEMTLRDSASKPGNMARLTRNNFTLKESKIAAIFRGVAYGVPTENPALGNGVIKLPMNIFKKPIFHNVDNDESREGTKPTVRRPSGAEGGMLDGKSPRGRIEDITSHSFDSSTDVEEETQIESDHLDNLPTLEVHPSDTIPKNGREDMSSNSLGNNRIDIYREEHRNEETYGIREGEMAFTTEPARHSDSKNFDNPNSDDEQIKNGEVIVLSHDLQNRSYSERWDSVKRTLGVAWPIHIHSATCVFGILTVISIYQLSRGKVWHDVSPGLFVLFYISIITATSLRSASYFLDAFGAEGRIPVVLAMILWNLSSPIILSVLAIFLLVLLKTSNSSLTTLRSIIILSVCLLHVLFCLAVELSPEFLNMRWMQLQLQIYLQIFTASWGFIVTIAYTILLNRIERQYRPHQKVAEPIILPPPPPRLRRAARVSILAAGCHIILSGIIIFCLVMPEQPPVSVREINVWMWFTQQCLARFFEVILCICLLFASCALVHCKQGDCPPTQRSSLCSMFTKCCVNGASGVHPASKRTQPLAIFTLNKHRSSFDYATNDFQLVWNKSRSNDANGDSSREPNDQENITYLRPASRNLPPMKFLPSSSRSIDSVFTPSPDEYFSSPLSKSTTGLYDNIQIESASTAAGPGLQPYLPCKGFYVNNYKYIGATLPNRLGSGGGSGAADRRSPLCNEAGGSASPGFGSSYWSPLVPSPRIRQNDLINDERGSHRSGPGNCHSTDYLSAVVSANKRTAGGDLSSSFRLPTLVSRNDHGDDELQSPYGYRQHSSSDVACPKGAKAPSSSPAAALSPSSSSANTLWRRNDPEKDIKISSSSRTTRVDLSGRWKPVHTLPLRLSSPRRKKSERSKETLNPARDRISE